MTDLRPYPIAAASPSVEDDNDALRIRREGSTMKLIIWALLAAAGVVVFVGKDDIRRFQHMRHI